MTSQGRSENSDQSGPLHPMLPNADRSQSFLFINMATVSDSSWQDFFSGLINLLDIYENYSLDIYLDFPSAAIFIQCKFIFIE